MTIEKGILETKDLDLEKPVEREGIINYADEKQIAEDVTAYVDKLVMDNTSALESVWDDLMHYDYMFRCGKNAAEKASHKPMASPEDPKSNVGATMFFRQVMQSAAKVYSLQSARDAYWKYSPISTYGINLSAEDGKTQAAQLNTLSQWSLDQDAFEQKLITIDMMVAKYGFCFVGAGWRRKAGVREIRVPAERDENGKITKPSEKISIPTLYENRPTFTVYDPTSVILDPNIDNIQDQECVCFTSVLPFSEAISLVEQGYWSEEKFREITSTHGWDGTAGRPRAQDKADNADELLQTSTKAQAILVWDAYVNLPLGEDGKLDQKKNVPSRFRCTFVGNKISQGICVRIEENDYPDDIIPLEIIHDYPDDPGRLIHISKGSVLKSNYAVESTAVNQMIDGVSLVLQPPTIERKGAVFGKNRKYGRSSRIEVKNSVNEDIREFMVQDRTQTGLALLEYSKNDSKMAIHTDPAQMGEGLGARATATESSGVMRLSAAPSVMNAKYITAQLFIFLATEMKRLWQEFADDTQVIQITDTDSPIQTIMPASISGEFDVRIDVVDRVVDDIQGEQKVSQDIQMFSANPELIKSVDVPALLDEYFIRRYGKSYVKQSQDADAAAIAQRDINLIRSGKAASAQQGQNHAIHLNILKAERVRYRGVEEQFPFIVALDRLIEQHTQMSGNAEQPAKTEQPAQQAAPEGAPEAAMGGAANMKPQAGTPA
jgi:hypothetical protein